MVINGNYHYQNGQCPTFTKTATEKSIKNTKSKRNKIEGYAKKVQ